MSSSYYSIPSITLSASETATVLTGTSSLDDEHLRALLAVLLSAVRNVKNSSLSVVELVFACFTIAVPELVTQSASLRSVNRIEILVSNGAVDAFINDSEHAESDLASFVRRYPFDIEAVVVTDADGLFAAVASLLMAIGRQPGSGSEAAGVKSRPKALIDRFKITDEASALMPGRRLGPKVEQLDLVHSAFSTYTEFRMLLVQVMLGIRDSVGHPPRHIEILMTNFRLMRGAGMTHVTAIVKLMNMHPWTVRVPELAPFYSLFAKELTEFEKIPLTVREYHRLLVPQGDFKFLTSEYKPLVAIAGHYVKEVEDQFKNYVYGANDFAALIAKVQLYEPTKASFIGSGILAQKLGIQDVELPEIKPASAPVRQANL